MPPGNVISFISNKTQMKIIRLLIFHSLMMPAHFVSAQSQITEYKPFRLYYSIGTAVDLHFVTGGPGICFSGELAYNISKPIFLGLKVETGSVKMAKSNPSHFGEFLTAMPTFNRYLDDQLNRWFIGAGSGFFYLDGGDSTQLQLGLMARIGVDRHHLHLASEINYTGRSAYTFSNSFLCLKIGIMIGGGKRR